MNILKPTCILPIALLAACSPPQPTFSPDGTQNNVTVPQSATSTASASRKAAGNAASVASWQLSGAMAARGNNKAWSASVNWQQQGMDHYNIRLSGPLGSGTVLIGKQGGVVTYKDGPKTASSSSADDLLQKQTGIRLPLNNFYYWVRGIPAPGAVQAEKRDTSNHLVSFKQAGYTVNYGGFTRVGNVDLPNRINLQGHGVTIKLIVKNWSV